MVLDAATAEALIARVKQENTPHLTSKSLFASVAKWVPGRLQQESWDSYWGNWLPDSKIGLADALGAAGAKGDAPRLLIQLKHDDDAAVRRAANRALGLTAPQLLLDWCISHGHSDRVGFRQRTAETLWWIPPGHRSKTWHRLAAGLVVDRYNMVRQAARIAADEDQRRRWADDDCRRIVDLVEGEAAAVLNVWRYGEALVEVGDDETLRRLVEHLQEVELPRNVRRWKVQIAKRLEKSWNERNRKRLDERAPVQPRTEEGVGSCRTAGDAARPVSYAVWHANSGAGRKDHGWGGTLMLFGEHAHHPFQEGEIRLTFEDGQAAKVSALSAHHHSCIGFTGLEDYPGTGKLA